MDVGGLGASDRPLPAANLDLKRIAERCDRDDLDRGTGNQPHLEQPAAKRPGPVDAHHLDDLPQRRLRERLHDPELPFLKIVFNISFSYVAAMWPRSHEWLDLSRRVERMLESG